MVCNCYVCNIKPTTPISYLGFRLQPVKSVVTAPASSEVKLHPPPPLFLHGHTLVYTRLETLGGLDGSSLVKLSEVHQGAQLAFTPVCSRYVSTQSIQQQLQ
jgi:hypothetical protein